MNFSSNRRLHMGCGEPLYGGFRRLQKSNLEVPQQGQLREAEVRRQTQCQRKGKRR